MIAPIRREIVVSADPATAFEIFTSRIGRWWPLERLSIHGADATVAFIDGELVERSAAGERAVWGTVTRWEPASVVAFTWHPGREPDKASHVEVSFMSAGEQSTLVVLEHSGWEAYEDPEAARTEYGNGWPTVIELYREAVRAAPDSDGGETWVALLHRPGPSAPKDGSVFDDARFAEHMAFLARLREAGYLFAAGPLTDRHGEGMAILRMPGADGLELATHLATEDDTSVSGGLLEVAVRPWQVMLRG